eukprot:scaffold41467_cov18-Tisochrysis_lutea.AAC.1
MTHGTCFACMHAGLTFLCMTQVVQRLHDFDAQAECSESRYPEQTSTVSYISFPIHPIDSIPSLNFIRYDFYSDYDVESRHAGTAGLQMRTHRYRC